MKPIIINKHKRQAPYENQEGKYAIVQCIRDGFNQIKATLKADYLSKLVTKVQHSVAVSFCLFLGIRFSRPDAKYEGVIQLKKKQVDCIDGELKIKFRFRDKTNSVFIYS